MSEGRLAATTALTILAVLVSFPVMDALDISNRWVLPRPLETDSYAEVIGIQYPAQYPGSDPTGIYIGLAVREALPDSVAITAPQGVAGSSQLKSMLGDRVRIEPYGSAVDERSVLALAGGLEVRAFPGNVAVVVDATEGGRYALLEAAGVTYVVSQNLASQLGVMP